MMIGKHAFTPDTPTNILLGAGTYHKGLKFESGGWSGTVLGATSGGGKIAIKSELLDLEIDGVLVKTKGMTVKQGGAASAEINFVEITTDTLKMATLFEEGDSDADGFTMLQDKETIEEGDYIDNFGFVGFTADGTKQIVVIFESALCTSGLEVEPKSKEQSVVKLTLEAVAKKEGSLNKLPVKIYYPTGA
jgi:hypothetical protein